MQTKRLTAETIADHHARAFERRHEVRRAPFATASAAVAHHHWDTVDDLLDTGRTLDGTVTEMDWDQNTRLDLDEEVRSLVSEFMAH